MSQARQYQSKPAADVELPGDNLSLNEMLRVMDVAREMGRDRVTAEKMFRRSGVREQLREKLMRSAQLSGDQVTEAEVEAAIDQYFQNQHVYRDPAPSWSRFTAYAWIWRRRIAAAAVAAAMASGTIWLLLSNLL
ncbi:DUF6384 family protein [Roseimaritima ulvae]|uniref:Uncharacterized protein n=1 Tax=Roseimaritima ulvae TaxID=980254 RepID=A0A5B9R0M1_9BACT|nr:DUF6384 family protein [Roseimaritima ulvae]QEG39801.1 hypothetical protein UC8_18000 [Roseimaritima ulvae]